MSGTALDPTIPLRAGQNVQKEQQPDIFSQLAKVGYVRALNNQNQLFPGQQTLQQQQITSGDLANQAAQTKLTQLNNSAVGAYIAPAVANGGGIDAYTTALARAHNAGFNTDSWLSDLHSIDPSDQSALTAWGKTRLASGLTPAESVNAALPGVTNIDNGLSIQPNQTAPALAPNRGELTPVGGGADLFPNRTVQSTPTIAGYDANNNPIYKPAAVVNPPYLTGPVAPAFKNGGRMPPTSLLNPNAPQHSVGSEPNADSTGTVVHPGPASVAAQEKTGAASAAAMDDYTTQGVSSKPRAAILDNMLGDTAQFTTGPGQQQIQKLQEIAGRLGLNIDTKGLSAAESFNKLAAQLASAQQGASGSDARLNVAQSANPHSDLSPAGVDLMLRQLRGNEDYIQARAALAQKYPNKADRAGFETSVQNLDPSTFQYDRMTPDQKADFYNAMPKSNRASFRKNYDATHQLIGG